MKLKITDEKLNKFIQGYLDRGTEPTYLEVAEMVEIYYQFKVDKLMSIIEMQRDKLKEIITHVKPHRDGLDGRFEETKSTIVACNALAAADKMLKELKGIE